MALPKEKVAEVIKEYQSKSGDTGSADVQVALLTARIAELTEHLKIHRKDKHSRRGLIQMVNKRSSLLKYIYSKNHEDYRQLCKKLDIRAKLEKNI